MTQDNALRKVLKKQVTGLSPDFNEQLLNRIFVVAEQRKKRSFVLGLCAISAASLSLVSVGIYLLKDYLTFSFHLPAFKLSPEALGIFGFSFYIAILILLLMVLDNYIRHRLSIKKS